MAPQARGTQEQRNRKLRYSGTEIQEGEIQAERGFGLHILFTVQEIIQEKKDTFEKWRYRKDTYVEIEIQSDESDCTEEVQ